MLRLFLALFFTSTSLARDYDAVRFPVDESVLDAKKDLGAKGDGIADDTAALQKGIDLSCGYMQNKSKVLFLPNGTYRVTKSLIVQNALGPWLYGESRDGTIIKLADGVKDVTAVIRTHPREKGPTSADWFMRNIRNITINVGNNPNTDGIRYYATNSGILQNIRVMGNGKVGINAGFLDQSGPNLIQDAVVEGFETGILSQWIWGETMSRITINKCQKVGISVSANSVAIEDLTVEDTPLPIQIQEPNGWGHWAGVVSLIGANLKNGNPKGPAIENKGVLYARHIKTEGFKSSIESGTGKNETKTTITEYHSHPKKFVTASEQPFPVLSIQSEPHFAWENDLNKWVCANEYGANSGDNQDDSAAIQKAIDAAAKDGKTIVYFRGCGGGDPNWYTVDQEIQVHGSVRAVLGLGWARILGGKEGKFVVSDKSAPIVKFQNIDSFGGPPVILENRSKQNILHAESCGVKILGNGMGDIYVTDCPSNVTLAQPGQKLWARHLNAEGESDTGLIQNQGGLAWILGMKNEGKGIRIHTSKAGTTEVFGVFNYGPGIPEGDRRPMFEVIDANLGVYGLRELAFGGNCFRVKVRETMKSKTKSLGDDVEGGWIGWSIFQSIMEK